MSDLSAAFLFGQLEQRKLIQEKRRVIWKHYFSHLSEWAKENEIQLPFVPEYCKQSYHMFYLIMPSLESRTQFITDLKKNGLHAVFHYLPLHLSPMAKRLSKKRAICPNTEEISNRIVRLPFFTNLNIREIDFNIFYNFN